MKMGFRTPSPKRSFSARTTGKINRAVKKATNPLYGKKGMGYVNNPKRAVYNKVYNKTTFGMNDMIGSSQNCSADSCKSVSSDAIITVKKQQPRWLFYFYLVISIFILMCNIFMASLGSVSALCILLSIGCVAVTVYYGLTTRKKSESEESSNADTLKDNNPSYEPIKINVTSETVRNSQYTDLIENALKQHEEYIATSTNPKWHRTQEEKHASDDFYINNQDDIKYYEDKIYNDGIAYNKQISIPDRIYACNKSIEAFYEFQRYCYRSFGGTIYFQNHWEYCHNSKEECFSYVRDLEALLPKLEKLKKLEQDVYDVLENTPEITQTELYKFFDSSLKRKILNILLEWESYGIIKRAKKGNTYLIKLIK